MSLRHIYAACLFLTAAFSTEAFSQQRVPCGDRTEIFNHLKSGYGEDLTAMGLDAQGRVLEILTAPSGTWTMLVTTPGGLTCLIGSGVAWEEIKLPEPDVAS